MKIMILAQKNFAIRETKMTPNPVCVRPSYYLAPVCPKDM